MAESASVSRVVTLGASRERARLALTLITCRNLAPLRRGFSLFALSLSSPCRARPRDRRRCRHHSPPFDSGGLASVFDFDPFAHVVAYGDPNRLGLLTSSNGSLLGRRRP